MMKLFVTRTAKEAKSRKEKPTSHFIPYKCHWNHNTILTKKNELLQVIKVPGFSFETADDEDIDIKKEMRNRLFKGFATGQFAVYFHTIRRKTDIVGISV